jgi:hypothetical protein
MRTGFALQWCILWYFPICALFADAETRWSKQYVSHVFPWKVGQREGYGGESDAIMLK